MITHEKVQKGMDETHEAYFEYHDEKRLIVSLIGDRGKWIVASNEQVATAKWRKTYDAFEPAYTEYYKRILDYLEYEFTRLTFD